MEEAGREACEFERECERVGDRKGVDSATAAVAPLASVALVGCTTIATEPEECISETAVVDASETVVGSSTFRGHWTCSVPFTRRALPAFSPGERLVRFFFFGGEERREGTTERAEGPIGVLVSLLVTDANTAAAASASTSSGDVASSLLSPLD